VTRLSDKLESAVFTASCMAGLPMYFLLRVSNPSFHAQPITGWCLRSMLEPQPGRHSHPVVTADTYRACSRFSLACHKHHFAVSYRLKDSKECVYFQQHTTYNGGNNTAWPNNWKNWAGCSTVTAVADR